MSTWPVSALPLNDGGDVPGAAPTRMSPDEVISGLPSKSAKIRALDLAGYSRSEIAKILSVSYQHVRSVLVKGAPGRKLGRAAPNPDPPVSTLTVSELLRLGFVRAGRWVKSGDGILLEADLPASPGLYAFAIGEVVVYIGIASRRLPQRLYGYRRPISSQKTNKRINPLIRAELDAGHEVSIFVGVPGTIEWKGLVIDLAPSIEVTLIRLHGPLWNLQSARRGNRRPRA